MPRRRDRRDSDGEKRGKWDPEHDFWADQCSAVCRDDARRHRGRFLVDADAGPAEYGKGQHDDGGERQPELAHGRTVPAGR